MNTITFYSYKGGTGRSLALANAARYLARLEFRVVALDFDLEAPGLHYKFSTSSDGKALAAKAGVVDYLHSFIIDGQLPNSLKDFTVDVTVPGSDKPLIQLIPAGRGPSKEYWSKLSRINWHELFYSRGAKGVQVFLDLKERIHDELKPDFLLIDSRTGITEMGGVATTLLADKVISLVLPSRENLEGARAVLRSLRRSRRESGAGELEIMVALSRLPEMKKSGGDREWIEQIRTTLNEEADDLKDTLSCSEVFVLHSEAALEIRESLRVGSGMSPDESVLLRDYLRLFASVVPRNLIKPKLGKLIQLAKEKIWIDPEAAQKELEELAESFGHPETYRELLRFYEVRNVGGLPALKRAQRLWELTRDSKDPLLWQVLQKCFDSETDWSDEDEWSPAMEFVEAVWHDVGKREKEFGKKIADAYNQQDLETRAADILLEIIDASGPDAEVVSDCIGYLDTADRGIEAHRLIQGLKTKLFSDTTFIEAWARHALARGNKSDIAELTQAPFKEQLANIRATIAAQVFFKAGLMKDASGIADRAMRDLRERGPRSERELRDVSELFHELGRWDDLEKTLEGRFPSRILEEMRERFGARRRRNK
jgi:MinD-like ATPase involved in chromosome partitioning or flagellar assembly